MRRLAVLALFLGLAAAPASASLMRLAPLPSPPPGARVLSALPAGTPLRLTIALTPRAPTALRAYAQAVSTPGSSLYHHYLTVAQFVQRFAPTARTVAAVRASLQARGLNPGPLTANGLAMPVSTTAAAASTAFSTPLERYVLRSGRIAFASARAPALDRAVIGAVQGVLGLSSLAAPHPMSIHRLARGYAARGRVVTGGPQPCAQASAVHANTADQIASAYRLSGLYAAGDLGAGQTIALYELDPFSSNDIQAYQSCYGTSTTVTSIPVDGGAAGAPQGEAALDIEDVIGLAPRARILVYSGPNADVAGLGTGPYDTYLKIISDDQAKVISTSFGLCEAQQGADAASAENTLFQEAAVQGQAVFAASGDAGAADCADPVTQLPMGPVAVDDPSSQPFVTGVGGSTLSALGPPPQETVWNGHGGAGGGGVSTLWPMPSYQSTTPPRLNVINGASTRAPCGSGSSFCREVPDVSLDADPATGYAIFSNGSWGAVGGTSAAAPTWAALLTLVNASSGCAGGSVGFANPALYRVAASAYTSVFNDITLGNNDFAGYGGFSAGPGYDIASGLGTPSGAQLAGALCDRVTVASPGNQTSVQGAPVALSVRARSSTGQPLSFAATGLPAGLSLNPVTGRIAGAPSSAGATSVSIVARDGYAEVGSVAFVYWVRRPTIVLRAPGPQRATTGRRVRLQLTASINNGRSLVYSVTGLPPGLSLSRRTGLVSGTPRRAGQYRITARAFYASGSFSQVGFTWVVNAPGRAR